MVIAAYAWIFSQSTDKAWGYAYAPCVFEILIYAYALTHYETVHIPLVLAF